MSSAEPDRWLLRDVDLDGRRADCRIRSGTIVALAPGLDPEPGEQVLDAHGGTLLPGLADHHLHLFACAAMQGSLDLAGGTDLHTLPETETETDGWLRVVGAGREYSLAELDARWPHRPVRVAHRSGALWMLNSAAIDAISAGLTADERSTGQLWRADTRLRELLAQRRPPDLAALGRTLAGYGITHVTDATRDLDETAIALIESQLPQHLLSLAGAGTGPRKIIVADHDLQLPSTLTAEIRANHDLGRPVAIHAVTAVALAICLAAFDEAGSISGDRIEHAAVCTDQAAEHLTELNILVVTQPSVFARHQDMFLAESPTEERDALWRYAGLIRAGVAVAASSDAPYGDLDPWQTIRSAGQRGIESVAARTVLTSMLTPPADPSGAPRTVSVGQPADLCLLDQPLDIALKQPAPVRAAATFIDGHLVHRTR